jgi:integrase
VQTLADACPGERERAFFLTAAWSGLRLFEVGRLLPADVNGNRLTVRNGKGNKPRVAVIREPGLSALLAVLDDGPFRTSRGNPWERRQVNRWWQETRRAVDIPGLRFHVATRHFFATWLLDQGATEIDCAIALGHVRNNGMPNSKLIRTTYGHPNFSIALDRVAALA